VSAATANILLLELWYDRIQGQHMLETCPRAINELGLPLGLAIVLKLRVAHNGGNLRGAVRSLSNRQGAWLEHYIMRFERLFHGFLRCLDIVQASLHETFWVGQVWPVLQELKQKRRTHGKT
jgi:hypothetical protein